MIHFFHIFRKKDPSINGATYGVAGGSRHGECFCEKGMTHADGDAKWISKKIVPGKEKSKDLTVFSELRDVRDYFSEMFRTP